MNLRTWCVKLSSDAHYPNLGVKLDAENLGARTGARSGAPQIVSSGLALHREKRS